MRPHTTPCGSLQSRKPGYLEIAVMLTTNCVQRPWRLQPAAAQVAERREEVCAKAGLCDSDNGYSTIYKVMESHRGCTAALVLVGQKGLPNYPGAGIHSLLLPAC